MIDARRKEGRLRVPGERSRPALMKTFVGIGAPAILACGILSLSGDFPRGEGGVAAAAEEKGPSIADFMLVVHDRQGILPQVRQALAGSGPADEKAWKAVSARAEVVLALTENILRKRVPSKGSKTSWQEKVNAYQSVARALAEAATEKDAAGARAESAKLQKSCSGCHKAHQ